MGEEENRTMRFAKALWLIALIAALVALMSCSASYHIKRAKMKDPSLFVKDTIIQIDTIWKVVKKVDTAFKYQYDTVFFVKDSVKIKYYYSYKDSLVYIEADCPDCPSTVKTETITETVFVEPTLWDKIKLGLQGAGLLTFVAFVIWGIKQII